MSSVRENLIAAKALIDTPQKWAKGPHPDGCRMCSARAIEKVLNAPYASAYYHDEGRAIQAALDERGIFHAFVVYNDMEYTTHADIMALFDRAIANEEAKG